MALDISTVQQVRDMITLAETKINATGSEAGALIDHSALGTAEKEAAYARLAEVKERIDAEMAKLHSNLEILNSDLVESDEDALELVTNSSGSVELINELLTAYSDIAKEETNGYVSTNGADEIVVSDTEVGSNPADIIVEDQEVTVPKPDIDVPGVTTYEDKVSESDIIDNPVYVESSKNPVELDRVYDDILDPDLEGPEVVNNGNISALKEYDVAEALSGTGPLTEKISILRAAGKQSCKAIIARLDSYKKQMSLDHEVDPKRGANANYDLYTMLVKNLSKQYSEVKEVLDILCAYFSLESGDAFKEEALMRFDMQWDFGDQQLKEYKQIVMVLAIMCNPANRKRNAKRLNVDNCSFDIEIRSNLKRYFELD